MLKRIQAFCLSITLTAASTVPGVAWAQDDPVLAGYQRFYRGDKDGARQDLERLVAVNPGKLPARFALLQVLEDVSRNDRSLEAVFERQMDAFITDAGAAMTAATKTMRRFERENATWPARVGLVTPYRRP